MALWGRRAGVRLAPRGARSAATCASNAAVKPRGRSAHVAVNSRLLVLAPPPRCGPFRGPAGARLAPPPRHMSAPYPHRTLPPTLSCYDWGGGGVFFGGELVVARECKVLRWWAGAGVDKGQVTGFVFRPWGRAPIGPSISLERADYYLVGTAKAHNVAQRYCKAEFGVRMCT